MSKRTVFGALVVAAAALSIAAPRPALADDDGHGWKRAQRNYGGERHGRYTGNDYYYGGPPPVYYGGPPCRGRGKKVKVYNYYNPVPVAVPVAVPVFAVPVPVPPPYPNAWNASASNVVIRVGVDWIFGF